MRPIDWNDARDALDGEASGFVLDCVLGALVADGVDPARLLAELPGVSEAALRAAMQRRDERTRAAA